MKKTITILLTVLCIAALLVGCGAASGEAQALENLIAANTTEALLQQYDSVSATFALSDGAQYLIYVDHETFLFADDANSMYSLYTPQEQCEVETVDGTVYFHRYINPYQEDLGAFWRESAFQLEIAEKETVSSYEQKDGRVYVTTQIKAGDISQEEMAFRGFLLENGDTYYCDYEADANTFCVIRTEEYILRADGTREDLGTVTITANAEPPEIIAELEAKGQAIDAMPAEDTRVITCIVDPGLETEYAVSKTVEKDSYVMIPEDLQGYEMYMDAEGTQPFTGAPEDSSSFTIYLIKK